MKTLDTLQFGDKIYEIRDDFKVVEYELTDRYVVEKFKAYDDTNTLDYERMIFKTTDEEYEIEYDYLSEKEGKRNWFHTTFYTAYLNEDDVIKELECAVADIKDTICKLSVNGRRTDIK
jgi:hypothetical protein